MTKQKLVFQVGKFGLVGLLNTLIDIFLLNILIKLGLGLEFPLFGYKVVGANIVSVTVAMTNSYFLNKYWTFEAKKSQDQVREVLRFIFITVIGMFLLHQIVFNSLLTYWTKPAHLMVDLSHFLGLGRIFSDSFIILNFAKLSALVVSLVWNFIGYRLWVFKTK